MLVAPFARTIVLEAGYLILRTIDAAFKSVAAKVPASQQLKHKVTFATVDLSNSRELFQKVNISL